MYDKIARLVIYHKISEDDIIKRLTSVFKDLDKFTQTENSANKEKGYVQIFELNKEDLITRCYDCINRLLDIATTYGYDRNLWQCHLAYTIAFAINPFSLSCEKYGSKEGTVNRFALSDFKIYKELFHYDFSKIEKILGINCFSTVTDYRSQKKSERQYNKNVSIFLNELALDINDAADEKEVFDIVTGFYKNVGVGEFGLNKAFRIAENPDGTVRFVPITNTEDIRLKDLVGYELQKKKLLDNTKAFVLRRTANNCLLYGDSGTGKSTSIKAVLNEFYDDGLRMIEIYKHQFKYLSTVISQIKNRNYRFIIYMDDLSFEEFEIEYKYLKAVIEGGLEIKPENVLIYATSNRRHLIKETWNDRDDMENTGEIHRSDTMAEKLSLVARFGITINYSAPNQKDYLNIVKNLAAAKGLKGISEAEICQKALTWELYNGGRSGRCARQFIDYLSGLDEFALPNEHRYEQMEDI